MTPEEEKEIVLQRLLKATSCETCSSLPMLSIDSETRARQWRETWRVVQGGKTLQVKGE